MGAAVLPPSVVGADCGLPFARGTIGVVGALGANLGRHCQGLVRVWWLCCHFEGQDWGRGRLAMYVGVTILPRRSRGR